MPTKTSKPKPTVTYVAIESWAGNDMSVARGLRLKGDHAIVQQFPERFLPESTPDDEFERARAAFNAPAPPPEPLGRVKLRVLPGQGMSTLDGGPPPQIVQHQGRTYGPGDVLTAEGATAQDLLDRGFCEVAEPVSKRLGGTAKALANGKEVE